MPALPANVVRASRPARVVSWTDSGVLTAYPDARDGLQQPDAGYFDSASDAASALALKAALIGTVRRRFAVSLAEEIDIDPLTAIPTALLTDSELGMAAAGLVCRFEVNLETETSTIEVMG